MRRPYRFFAFCIILSFVACNQFDELAEIDGVQYDAEFAVPLVDSRLTMQDVLDNFDENATLVVGNDGLIRFIYRGEVVSKTSDDIFTAIRKAIPEAIPVFSPYMALPFSSPNGLQIDRLDLKGGTLSYVLQNPNNAPVNIKITLPQLTKDNVPLTYEVSLPAYSGTGALPTATNIVLATSLAGYRIQTLNDSVYIQYQAVTPSGNQVRLSGFFISLQGLAFQYAEGYFGNLLYEGSRDTINIDFFENWTRGDVYFENPRIKLSVENSFGIPTRARVNTLDVVTVRNEVLPLQSTYVINGIDFPYPSFAELGQVKRDSFYFTRDNSNIDKILSASPKAIEYDVDAVTNPTNNRNIRGYITDQSYYKVNMEVELPLYGRAAGFTIRDTLDLNFDEYDNVTDAEFKLVVDNGIPLDVVVQGYFLNASNQVIDSLLTAPQTVIASAPVDANGVANGTQQKITLIPIAEERFIKIRDQAQRLWINASFSTLNNGITSVRVLNSQQVRIRLGAKLGVKN